MYGTLKIYLLTFNLILIYSKMVTQRITFLRNTNIQCQKYFRNKILQWIELFTEYKYSREIKDLEQKDFLTIKKDKSKYINLMSQFKCTCDVEHHIHLMLKKEEERGYFNLRICGRKTIIVLKSWPFFNLFSEIKIIRLIFSKYSRNINIPTIKKNIHLKIKTLFCMTNIFLP